MGTSSRCCARKILKQSVRSVWKNEAAHSHVPNFVEGRDMELCCYDDDSSIEFQKWWVKPLVAASFRLCGYQPNLPVYWKQEETSRP